MLWGMEEGTNEGMQDLDSGAGKSFRRETPEVRLVVDAKEAVSALGENARRMIESLPKFNFVGGAK